MPNARLGDCGKPRTLAHWIHEKAVAQNGSPRVARHLDPFTEEAIFGLRAVGKKKRAQVHDVAGCC